MARPCLERDQTKGKRSGKQAATRKLGCVWLGMVHFCDSHAELSDSVCLNGVREMSVLYGTPSLVWLSLWHSLKTFLTLPMQDWGTTPAGRCNAKEPATARPEGRRRPSSSLMPNHTF